MFILVFIIVYFKQIELLYVKKRCMLKPSQKLVTHSYIRRCYIYQMCWWKEHSWKVKCRRLCFRQPLMLSECMQAQICISLIITHIKMSQLLGKKEKQSTLLLTLTNKALHFPEKKRKKRFACKMVVFSLAVHRCVGTNQP